jgi:dissimilatory sulfite reductase (desulfoviridin) alpha/beta subunit
MKDKILQLAKKLKPFIDGWDYDELTEIVNNTFNSEKTLQENINAFINKIGVYINGLDAEEIGEYCMQVMK